MLFHDLASYCKRTENESVTTTFECRRTHDMSVLAHGYDDTRVFGYATEHSTRRHSGAGTLECRRLDLRRHSSVVAPTPTTEL